jgi:hypothetical protein
MAVSSTFDYSNYSPLDNTLKRRSPFASAYKNLRYAMPVNDTLIVTESDIGNLAGIAFRIYQDTSLWRLILAYNGMQDPIQDMWPGQVLEFPSKSNVIQYLNSQLYSQNKTITI